jgi:hypothetical protein
MRHLRKYPHGIIAGGSWDYCFAHEIEVLRELWLILGLVLRGLIVEYWVT